MDRNLSATYKMLRFLGFNYPEEEYGDVSLWRVVRQFFVNMRMKGLEKMMDWTILEPLNPRKIRPMILRKMGCTIGNDVFIGDYVSIDPGHGDLITIEDHAHLDAYCVLLCHKRDLSGYYIGGDYAKLPYKKGKIRLCKGCSVGTRSLVMPGVTIGEGAIIGACSLVTKDIPAWTIAVGCPAKVVKRILKRDEMKQGELLFTGGGRITPLRNVIIKAA